MMSTNDNFFSVQESTEDESNVKHEYVAPAFSSNLEAIESSNSTEFSALPGELKRSTQFILGNDQMKYSTKPSIKFKNEILDQRSTHMKENAEESDANLKYSSKVDHVYEEVNALECDIMDYYEKYSPTTAKTLINTLFLPRHKICKQCANSQYSPVFSDCLIYAKKPVLAKEVHLFQQCHNTLCFMYRPENVKHSAGVFSQYDDVQDCLLVYNYSKTNASSIFYFYGPPRDVFDLKTALEPNILLTSSKTLGVVNTELYHRSASNFYTRISNNGIAPAAFRMDHSNILSSIKHVGYDTDLQNWMNYRNDVFRSHGLKQDDAMDHRANRSSLLLLEPLLLMPELTSPRYRHAKNRISQSEHMKIVKIVIAYTLSFLTLATITFYIVYFT